MARMGTSSSALVNLLVVATISVIWAAATPASAQLSPSACKAERWAGINACKAVLYGAQPSPQCCERIRVTPTECVCAVITPQLLALVDVNRMIRLVEGCGRPVPHNFKCGSFTTPLLT